MVLDHTHHVCACLWLRRLVGAVIKKVTKEGSTTMAQTVAACWLQSCQVTLWSSLVR